MLSASQRCHTKDKSPRRPPSFQRAGAAAAALSRGGAWAGALREHAKTTEKNTAKTFLSDSTQKCLGNLRLKVRGSGRGRCGKALLPGKEDTDKAPEGDTVMEDKNDVGVGRWGCRKGQTYCVQSVREGSSW